MLTKQTPETLTAIATVKMGDVSLPLKLTYHNRKQSELAAIELQGSDAIPDAYKANPMPWMQAQVALFIIKSFDDGTDKEYPLSLDGLLDMENDYNGVLGQLVNLFHKVRAVSVEKN